MTTTKKTVLPKDANVPVNARIAVETLVEAKKLAEKAGKSMTDFVRDAMENEVSRLTLCKPKHPVSLDEIMVKLDAQQEILTALSAQNRLQAAQLAEILQAIGLPT